MTQVFGILTLGAADSFVKLAGFNVLLEGLIMFMYMTFSCFMIKDPSIQEIREERKQKALQEEDIQQMHFPKNRTKNQKKKRFLSRNKCCICSVFCS